MPECAATSSDLNPKNVGDAGGVLRKAGEDGGIMAGEEDDGGDRKAGPCRKGCCDVFFETVQISQG